MKGIKNMKTRLSKKEILESFGKGERTPVENLSERKKALAEYARNTLKKDKRLNIRISEGDSQGCRGRRSRKASPTRHTFQALFTSS